MPKDVDEILQAYQGKITKEKRKYSKKIKPSTQNPAFNPTQRMREAWKTEHRTNIQEIEGETDSILNKMCSDAFSRYGLSSIIPELYIIETNIQNKGKWLKALKELEQINNIKKSGRIKSRQLESIGSGMRQKTIEILGESAEFLDASISKLDKSSLSETDEMVEDAKARASKKVFAFIGRFVGRFDRTPLEESKYFKKRTREEKPIYCYSRAIIRREDGRLVFDYGRKADTFPAHQERMQSKLREYLQRTLLGLFVGYEPHIKRKCDGNDFFPLIKEEGKADKNVGTLTFEEFFNYTNRCIIMKQMVSSEDRSINFYERVCSLASYALEFLYNSVKGGELDRQFLADPMHYENSQVDSIVFNYLRTIVMELVNCSTQERLTEIIDKQKFIGIFLNLRDEFSDDEQPSDFISDTLPRSIIINTNFLSSYNETQKKRLLNTILSLLWNIWTTIHEEGGPQGGPDNSSMIISIKRKESYQKLFNSRQNMDEGAEGVVYRLSRRLNRPLTDLDTLYDLCIGEGTDNEPNFLTMIMNYLFALDEDPRKPPESSDSPDEEFSLKIPKWLPEEFWLNKIKRHEECFKIIDYLYNSGEDIFGIGGSDVRETWGIFPKFIEEAGASPLPEEKWLEFLREDPKKEQSIYDILKKLRFGRDEYHDMLVSLGEVEDVSSDSSVSYDDSDGGKDDYLDDDDEEEEEDEDDGSDDDFLGKVGDSVFEVSRREFNIQITEELNEEYDKILTSFLGYDLSLSYDLSRLSLKELIERAKGVMSNEEFKELINQNREISTAEKRSILIPKIILLSAKRSKKDKTDKLFEKAEIIEMSHRIGNFLCNKRIIDILGENLSKYYMVHHEDSQRNIDSLKAKATKQKTSLKKFAFASKTDAVKFRKALDICVFNGETKQLVNDIVRLIGANRVNGNSVEEIDQNANSNIGDMIDSLVDKKEKQLRDIISIRFNPSIQSFWITLIIFILIIFNNWTLNEMGDDLIVKGGVSLILNTEEIPHNKPEAGDLTTSDVDISVRPNSKYLPNLVFNLMATIICSGKVLLTVENIFNEGLDLTELRKYNSLNFVEFISSNGELTKLVQIGKISRGAVTEKDFICDIITEERPFRQPGTTLSSEHYTLPDGLPDEINRDIFDNDLSTLVYFQYKSLDGNLSEYENMFTLMKEYVKKLLSRTVSEEEKSNFMNDIKSFSPLYTKVKKFKSRLMNFQGIEFSEGKYYGKTVLNILKDLEDTTFKEFFAGASKGSDGATISHMSSKGRGWIEGTGAVYQDMKLYIGGLIQVYDTDELKKFGRQIMLYGSGGYQMLIDLIYKTIQYKYTEIRKSMYEMQRAKSKKRGGGITIKKNNLKKTKKKIKYKNKQKLTKRKNKKS